MRCHYLSDLHLEAQGFRMALPKGDVLIIAGDLCHARCLDPARSDGYSVAQRDRAMRLIDEALRKFPHVLLIAGNHEHYDGVFEETTETLRRHLPGVTVLDDEAVQIDGVRFFGSTLWTDLSGQTEPEVTAIRKGMGEYFFVKSRSGGPDQALGKLRPADTHRAHETAWTRLREAVTAQPRRSTVVITHHAPSCLGLNPRFAGSPLDPAYASSLDEEIAAFENVPVWVHGHTHIAKTYRIGNTVVRSNALGLKAKGGAAPGFSVKAHFDIK
jgi:Icc-related predicted phosphoesterase